MNKSEVTDSSIPCEEIIEYGGLDSSDLNSIAVIIAFLFIIGLINNALACIVIVSSKTMHTATSCYLFSLSMSDILVLITGTTQEMYNIYSPSQLPFGIVGCSFKNWAAEMSLNVSILTIAAFTVERYLAICYPFYTRVTSQFSKAIKILIAMWLFAALCALAPALYTRMFDDEDFNDCYLDSDFLPYYLEVSSIIFFIMPLILMTIMYIQIGIRLKKSNNFKGKNNVINSHESHSVKNRNTVKMFAMIVVIFFICWTPFHVQRMMTSHILLFIEDPTTTFDPMIMDILKHGSVISYQLSAVMDPIIYSIMSLKFRQALWDLISKRSNNASNIYSTKTNNTRLSQYSNRV